MRCEAPHWIREKVYDWMEQAIIGQDLGITNKDTLILNFLKYFVFSFLWSSSSTNEEGSL